MKPMIYSAIAALLVLSSCSTAYQTAQTPDDVYYSPGKAKVYANNTARSTQKQASNAAEEETYNDNGDDNYVTYQDEDDERYDYARRIDRFGRGYNGNYWDGYYADQFYGYGSPNIYMNSYYGYPSWGNSFSIGLGWGYNPYRFNNWYGNGWYGGGFYGNPWYNNWYGGGGWYGGGYPGGYYPGGGWHNGGGYYPVYKPRPTNSWGPRGSSSSRVFNDSYNPSSPRPNTSGSAPRRVFDRSGGNVVNPGNPNGGRVNNGGVPRRTFDRAPSERPATQPDSRPARQAPVRNFDRSDDRPVRQSSPEPTYRAPAPERSAPERSFPSSSPSSSPSNNSPSPVRQSSPRRGG